MPSFILTLSNNASLSGIASIPVASSTSPKCRPLVVAIHGGSYSSKYFDALPGNSAVRISEMFGVPFVAYDRPGYVDSTAVPGIPSGSTLLQEEGKYTHRYVLPKIWEVYGKPSGATTMVVLAHSLGAGVSVVAAASHVQEIEPQYPLGGIIMSGWGRVKLPSSYDVQTMLDRFASSGRIRYDSERKDSIMLCHPQHDLVSPEMRNLTEALNTSVGVEEIRDVYFTWREYWESYAMQVKVPVMASLGERDNLWEGSEARMRTFGAGFSSSPRVETGVVLGAPHCMELSYWGPGWLLRCLGFAIECATSRGTD